MDERVRATETQVSPPGGSAVCFPTWVDAEVASVADGLSLALSNTVVPLEPAWRVVVLPLTPESC